MNSFEFLVAGLLERDGFWVRSSYKVELSAADKRAIGRPSSPRWEIDLVAYRAASNEVWIVECKSLINSRGVSAAAIEGGDHVNAKRYKLFNDTRLLRVVRRRLVAQLSSSGACRPRPHVKLCLVAGRIASDRDRRKLHAYFARKRWLLRDEKWLADQLTHVSHGGYEDSVASVVAKILLGAKKRKDDVTGRLTIG